MTGSARDARADGAASGAGTGRPRLVAFDLDDTLAPSKSRVEPEMADALSRLLDVTEVCVISGGHLGQFTAQVIDPLAELGADLERMHLLPTCGTRYLRFESGDWRQVYAEDLTDDEAARATRSIEVRSAELGFDDGPTWGPRIEHRGSQVTFSALGQEAPVDVKQQWDPSGAKKSALRAAVQADLPDLEVRSGGSTSIDITRKGVDKAYGMRRLIEATGIEASSMLFVGDRLDPDGNDFPVIATGVPCVAVGGWRDTLGVIEGVIAGRETE
ncbi:HAD-IIB family hydrolase [Agromyces sp. Marseille-Q5079]|uniref:HAD-IIB family hydrolase n=1 Tax=Agromyces sp. Marseille-Q5079 TaxID=3439059 RepID=UPI003D9CBBCE